MDFQTRYVFNPQADFLGKGGFSRVYRATDTLLDRTVALKFFTSDVSEKYQVLNEIKKVIRFEHPNLCKYYDVALLSSTNMIGELERTEVGIMEYLDSGDFKHFVRDNPVFLDKLFIDILKGLSYLHKKGIVHRDLKPQNILIHMSEEEPVAKITDFGISKLIDGENNNNDSSTLMGTIEYMAPEQFNPQKYGVGGRITTNMDLWSYGLLVYETVMNESMFGSRSSGTSAEQVMSNILSDATLERVELLPEKYQRVVSRCLVKNAAERAQLAEELIAIFEGRSTSDNKIAIDSVTDEETKVFKRPVFKEEKNDETLILNKKSFSQPGALVHSGSAENLLSSSVIKPLKETKSNKVIKVSLIILLPVLLATAAYFTWPYFSKAKNKTELNAGIKSIAPPTIYVKGSAFKMGSNLADASSAEKPLHQVIVNDFHIAKYEVTVQDFREFVKSTNYKTSAEVEGFSSIIKNNEWIKENNINWQHDVYGNLIDSTNREAAVIHVSWNDAMKYCEWLSSASKSNYRLPTEAEWEYAAKGANNSSGFIYSGSNVLHEVGWYKENAGQKINKVGLKKPNEIGLYDMSGNVMEWCSDLYEENYYANSPRENPKGPRIGENRVIRGGSWSVPEEICTVTYRLGLQPNGRGGNTGFRIVKQ